MLEPGRLYNAFVEGYRIVRYVRTLQKGRRMGFHIVGLYNPRTTKWNAMETVSPDQMYDHTPIEERETE